MRACCRTRVLLRRSVLILDCLDFRQRRLISNPETPAKDRVKNNFDIFGRLSHHCRRHRIYSVERRFGTRSHSHAPSVFIFARPLWGGHEKIKTRFGTFCWFSFKSQFHRINSVVTLTFPKTKRNTEVIFHAILRTAFDVRLFRFCRWGCPTELDNL